MYHGHNVLIRPLTCRGNKIVLSGEGVWRGVDIGALSGHVCEHNLATCHDITLSDYYL